MVEESYTSDESHLFNTIDFGLQECDWIGGISNGNDATTFEIIFVLDEAKGSTDPLEADISGLEEVNDCEVTDVRRAVG